MAIKDHKKYIRYLINFQQLRQLLRLGKVPVARFNSESTPQMFARIYIA